MRVNHTIVLALLCKSFIVTPPTDAANGDDMRGQKVIDTWAAPKMKPAMAGPITVSRPDAKGVLRVVAVIPSPGDVEMPVPALRRAITINHKRPINDDLVSPSNQAKRKENGNGN